MSIAILDRLDFGCLLDQWFTINVNYEHQ